MCATDRLFVITVGILMRQGKLGPETGVRYSRGFAIAEFVISEVYCTLMFPLINVCFLFLWVFCVLVVSMP